MRDVDLLLRKSQIVRGPAIRDVLSLKILDVPGKRLTTPPLGLKVTKKRKLKHSKAWPLIEGIHAEAAEGESNRKIALGLTADGYRSTRGGPFRSNTVGRSCGTRCGCSPRGWRASRRRSTTSTGGSRRASDGARTCRPWTGSAAPTIAGRRRG
ncbi:recombinase family protein [Kitasatospora sp. NA04385]|uniref:recombinase family protein n=1 Tax=Kitasatospora sp. NA04385 TaxID=2742135 RepID=UPI0015914CD5|nr:recombinase family protein [Kitasatospora sp. NA04385]QKW17658.1 recombinase family protein [Kitasatospora sp. NA04385]